MMVAQRSSALPYESLPTEEGEVPTSFTYRDANSRTPTVTHHPIPMGPRHPDRSMWVTCTLVTVLVVLASILGVIVGFAAQASHYPAILSFSHGITPNAGGSEGEAHGPSWGGHGGYESASSSEKTVDSWSTESGKGGETTSYSLESSGETSSASHSGEENVSSEYGKSPATESTRTAAPVVITDTTQVTTLPPATTTTPTTPAPTTASPDAVIMVTTTATPPKTASPDAVTMVTTTAKPPTTGSSPSGNTEGGAGASSASVGASSASVVTDGYNSSMGFVDYMVVMQKKMPVGLVLTILLAVILATVGLLAAIIYVVKRKTTKKRRRAHVRRAINELRAQDKSNLLQSDEEEG